MLPAVIPRSVINFPAVIQRSAIPPPLSFRGASATRNLFELGAVSRLYSQLQIPHCVRNDTGGGGSELAGEGGWNDTGEGGSE
jgi:hypothetical protein